MSSRVTIDVGFYFQKVHYAQLQAYLPRNQAANIPDLIIDSQPKNPELNAEPKGKSSRNAKSDSKKQSEDEMVDQDDNNDNQIQNEMENDEEQDNQIQDERQKEVEDALHELEEAEEREDSYDSDRDDDDIDSYDSLESPEELKNFTTNRTKRQKGEIKDLVELPDRRPRKGKMLDEATQIVRREEKERKRKQYLKKQIEAHQKATIDKILNETGRKLRQREEREIQEEMQREQKTYKTLGDVPKIIEINSKQGNLIMTHNSTLFPSFMTETRDIKMKEQCSKCGNVSKYTLKGGSRFACSLPCYKLLTA